MGENTIMISVNGKHFALLAYFEGEATVSQSVSQPAAGSWNWISISFSFQIKIFVCAGIWISNYVICLRSVRRSALFIRKAHRSTDTDSKPKSVYKQKTCFDFSQRAKSRNWQPETLNWQLLYCIVLY